MRRTAALALAASITAGFAWWMLGSETGRAALEAASAADGRLALACILLCGLTPVLRAARLLVVLPGRRGLYAASALHTAAAAVLPARLGEAVLPWLLRRAGATDLGGGIAVLVAVRVADLAAILVLAGLGGLSAAGRLPPGALAWSLGGAILCALGAALLLARWRGAREVLRARRVEAARTLASMNRRTLLGLIATTLALWSVLWGAAAAALASVGGLGAPGAAQAAGALAAASLAFASPVNGVASAGPFEAAFGGVAAAGGATLEAGIAAALILHASAFAAAMGGALAAQLASRPAPTPQPG